MPPRTRIVIALCFIATLGNALYWLAFFFVPDSVQSSAEACYLVFERSFPVADAWWSVCTLLAGIQLIRRRRSALLWGLLGASSLIYLAAIDQLHDVVTGLYKHFSFDVAVEVIIDGFALFVGVGFSIWFWRHRTALLALEG
jgi:hypothetical protein